MPATPEGGGTDPQPSVAQSSEPDTDVSFRSAEAWLADRGIRRDPIRVDAPPPPPAPPAPTASVDRGGGAAAEPSAADPTADPTLPGSDPEEPLGDAVARAVAFIRRSTSMHPASEQRIRDKLAQRDTRPPVIELAIEQARRERLVDDDALVHALAAERRAKGHAASRIRMDLRQRGFPDDLIARALAATDREDPEAVAFDVARARADTYAHLEPEAAYRRLVGYLARRGHAEGLARKVARQVVWVDREQDRVTGH